MKSLFAGAALTALLALPAFAQDDVTADTVLATNRGGAREATEHLIAVGHRRIAFLGDLTDIATAEERYKGYTEAMQAAGIAIDERLVRRMMRMRTGSAVLLGLVLALGVAPVWARGGQTQGKVRASRSQRSAFRGRPVNLDHPLRRQVSDAQVALYLEERETSLGGLLASAIDARAASADDISPQFAERAQRHQVIAVLPFEIGDDAVQGFCAEDLAGYEMR